MKNFLVLTALIALISCQPSDKQSVSGKLQNGEGKKIALIGYDSKGQADTLGSTVLNSSGDFNFPVAGKKLTFYTLAIQDNGSLILAFDSTESPVITGDLHYINRNYSVSGSPSSERIKNLFVASRQFEVAMDSTMKLMQSSESIQNDEDRLARATSFNKLRSDYRDYLLKFIDDDSTSIANLSVLQRLDPKTDLIYFQRVRNGLKSNMQGNVFYDGLANQVAQLERIQQSAQVTQAGRQAPDIALPDPNGEVQTLSSLKGKYVLIDFWASWCKPCRMENPNVVKLYDKYRKENFQILGVSLDQNREKWLEAIAVDQLKWLHVSDLQFWNSAAAKLYNVQSIPFTVLVDPEGKIMETNLRGPELSARLAQIYGY